MTFNIIIPLILHSTCNLTYRSFINYYQLLATFSRKCGINHENTTLYQLIFLSSTKSLFSNQVCPVGRSKYTTVLGNLEWKHLRCKKYVVCFGWFSFFNNTLCKYILRFIIIINKYLETVVLICMSAYDIVPLVQVANGLLYFNRRG